ncbi:MAG: four helix bundle protein [Flavobacteriales bacterium]|nr:four helix bundle protein [Flavobacteriales bacterium]
MAAENVILTKSFDFAVKVLLMCKRVRIEHREYDLTRQLMRSATSIGANAEEAIGGISRKDFSAKLGISYKEARESKFWLRLLHATEYITKNEYDDLVNDCEEILRILFSIIRTTNRPEE